MGAGQAAANGDVIREVVTFDEVREAWRCPHLSANTGGVGEEFFHKDTIVRLDGPDHLRRRRAMGNLLKRRGHKQFRDSALIPTARTLLDEVLSRPEADGYARMNLMRWGLRTNFRLGAAMVGFDDGRAGQGADELLKLMETLLHGRPSNISVATGQFRKGDAALQDAINARNEIITRYYEPSLQRRKAIVSQIAAGESTDDDLPMDLLSLIATEADPAWADPEIAKREALFLFNAGVHTTTVSLYWTLRELFQWLAANPDDWRRVQDDAYLLRAAEESMRLHPVTPGFPRRATQHVSLSGGTEIDEGDLVLIRSGPANIDPQVFGDDALEFDPQRQVPSTTKGYVYAFGLGSHQCFGMPVVMGAEGIDGSLVHMLKQLFLAGLQPDESGPEQISLEEARGGWSPEPEVYAVQFPVAGHAS